MDARERERERERENKSISHANIWFVIAQCYQSFHAEIRARARENKKRERKRERERERAMHYSEGACVWLTSLCSRGRICSLRNIYMWLLFLPARLCSQVMNSWARHSETVAASVCFLFLPACACLPIWLSSVLSCSVFAGGMDNELCGCLDIPWEAVGQQRLISVVTRLKCSEEDLREPWWWLLTLLYCLDLREVRMYRRAVSLPKYKCMYRLAFFVLVVTSACNPSLLPCHPSRPLLFPIPPTSLVSRNLKNIKFFLVFVYKEWRRNYGYPSKFHAALKLLSWGYFFLSEKSHTSLCLP